MRAVDKELSRLQIAASDASRHQVAAEMPPSNIQGGADGFRMQLCVAPGPELKPDRSGAEPDHSARKTHPRRSAGHSPSRKPLISLVGQNRGGVLSPDEPSQGA